MLLQTSQPPPDVKKHSIFSTIVLLVLGCAGVFFISCFIAFIIIEMTKRQYSWIAYFPFLPTILWAIKHIKEEIATNNKEKSKEKSAEAEYQAKLNQYHQELNQHHQEITKIERNRNVKIMIVKEERTKAENALAISTQHLQTIYDKNIIFPKYRNLVMVCSLYEYICAGRCNKLEGSEGAYNILELEIRLDRIITQLDRITVLLGKIQENQFVLYSAIQESNQRSAQILESTNRMVDNLQHSYEGIDTLTDRIAELQKTSELTAYCADRTQKELAYMNRMNYLSGRNDSVFWNVPPT